MYIAQIIHVGETVEYRWNNITLTRETKVKFMTPYDDKADCLNVR